jgi:ribosome maturation factor RimP
LKAREDDHLTIEVGKKEIKIPIQLIEKARLAILF